MMTPEQRTAVEAMKWDEALEFAIEALQVAGAKVNDLAGWSGSSGNWPLQWCSQTIPKALKILQSTWVDASEQGNAGS